MANAQIVFEELGPNGNVKAVVKQDRRAAYFYLQFNSELNRKECWCWIRNFWRGPRTYSDEVFEKGRLPMLPVKNSAHAWGSKRFDVKSLRVVWFEAGDGAALLEYDQVLAIIPWWSGTDGFHGYARDCTLKSPCCWPLETPEGQMLLQDIERADQWWKSWTPELIPYKQLESQNLTAYQQHLGNDFQSRLILADDWAPRSTLQFSHDVGTIFTTIGMALKPLPCVPTTDKSTSPTKRVELAIAISRLFYDHEVAQLADQLSRFTAYPWLNYTSLKHGDFVPFQSPDGELFEMEFPWVFLTTQPCDGPRISLPDFRGDHVELLWMIPLTDNEREIIRNDSIDEIHERLSREEDSWVHQDRIDFYFWY